jgi:hypothetical protein
MEDRGRRVSSPGRSASVVKGVEGRVSQTPDCLFNDPNTETYLIVDQSPLLQERMHPHDRSHVSSQIPPTRRHRQVLGRVQSIRIDHEIPVILVDLRRLAPVLAAEKLG